MPGIVGNICSNNGDCIRMAQSAETMVHFSWLRAAEVISTSQAHVGVVYRTHIKEDFDVFADERSGMTVILFGFASDSQTARKLSAKDILTYCDSQENRQLADVDGSFVLAILDSRNSQFRLINDRLGSLPIYYAFKENQFAFAPEAKGVVAGLDLDVSFAAAGVASFLTTGYCLGRESLFENVKVMTPASILTLDLDSWHWKEDTYWTLRYRADSRLDNRTDAESALWDALVDSMKCQTCDESNNMALMLSGGWDSRGMLPLMQEIGCEFSVAKSWGYLDHLPRSDVSLARHLAARYDLPFNFVQYSTSTFVENATDWCTLSELMNDNVGWYAEGPTTLRNDYDKSVECLFVGDEVWGWGTDVATDAEVRGAVLSPYLPDSVSRLLVPDFAEQCRHSYDETLCDIMSRCADDAPNDRKDFLYLYGRVARFIFSVGYYKELCTPLRRPYFGKRVLDVIQALPEKHRIFKNVYCSMLKRYAPRVADVPVATVNSLPDWNRDIRSDAQIRSFFESLLDSNRIANGPLGDWFDPQALSAVVSREMSKEVKPMSRRPARAKNLIGKSLRGNRVGRYLSKVLRPNGVRDSEAAQFRVLRRVALLSLLAENLDAALATH